MADIEGALETRGPGKVGKWEQFWFKLADGSLSYYPLDDAARRVPKNQFRLQDVSNLVEDSAKREFAFDFNGVKARFRANDSEEAQRWFVALQARAPVGTRVTKYRDESPRSASPISSPRGDGPTKCFWIQCDTVGSLVSDGQRPGIYAVRSRWRAAADAQETEPRDAVMRPGDVGLEDCFVRQQVLLSTSQNQKTVLVSVVRRDAEESTLIGSCELHVENAAHRIAATYELLNRKGEKIGVTARLKIKQADPTAMTLNVQEQLSPVNSLASTPFSTPVSSQPVHAATSRSERSVSRGPSQRERASTAPRTPRGDAAAADRSANSEYDIPEQWGTPMSTLKSTQANQLATIPAEPVAQAPTFTGSAMFASRSASPHRASIHRASSLRRKTTEEAFDAEQVPPMLDAIIKLLDENRLRVADLFRHPAYNPDFLETRKEELDAKALQGVLQRAGLDFESRSCRMLVRCLDETGSDTVSITELEAAVRARRRGKDKFHEVIRKETTSKLDFARKMSCGHSVNSPEVCMDAISDLLDSKHLRVHDLFRHPQYNPNYLETGSEELDADLMNAVLTKAGLELSLEDVQGLVKTIDEDGSGNISIDELENALRNYRRGVKVWENKDFIDRKDSAMRLQNSRKRSKSAQAAIHVKMYDFHAEKMDRLAQRKLQLQREQDAEITRGIAENRLGTRKHTDMAELHRRQPIQEFKGLQLHDHFKELQARHKERCRQHFVEEQAKIMSTKPEPSYRPSSPDERKQVDDIGDRLYQLAIERREYQKQKQVEHEVEALKVLKKDERVIRPGDQDRCHDLYLDAQNRKEKLEQSAKKHALEEVRYWAEMAERKQKHLPSSQEHEERIEELYKLHKQSQEKMTKMRLQYETLENDKIMATKKQLKERSQSCPAAQILALKVQSRWKEPFELTKEQKDQLQRRRDEATIKKGFGSTTPRKQFGQDLVKPHDYVEKKRASYSMHTHAEHCVQTLNAAVVTRTGRSQVSDEALTKELAGMVPLVEEVLTMYAEAQDNCRTMSTAALDLMQTQRIYNDKELVPDEKGFDFCIEPCPLMQKTENLDQLLTEAEKAHWSLLARIGPQDTSTMSHIDALELIKKRWPSGSRWHNPVAARGATFAYNPGPKTKSSTWAKAFTRYGPTVGTTRHRHMLDLARCTLVFPNQTLLRSGLQQITQDFRVVGIHNYYSPKFQNLLGDRCILVYVIMTEGLDIPHICELRLEEAAYFAARQDSEPILEAIGKRFSEIYDKTTTPPGCIKYLVKHVLTKAKPSHSLAVFRRHMARHYGSSVVAWRRMFGNAPTVSYNNFREVCCQLSLRKDTTQFWTELDPTLAGCISLFDLDPAAVSLLARFYSHLLGSIELEGDTSAAALFEKLASRTPANKPNKPGRLEAHEFRQAVKVFGFSWQEADRIFQYLDFMGGSAHVPPATVTVKDLGWLRSLNELVNIDMAMMTTGEEVPIGVLSAKGVGAAPGSPTAILGSPPLRSTASGSPQDSPTSHSRERPARMSMFLSSEARDFSEQQQAARKDDLQRQTEDASRRIAQGKARRSLMGSPSESSTGHVEDELERDTRHDDADGASSMGSLGSPRSPRSAASPAPGSPVQQERARELSDSESEYDDEESPRNSPRQEAREAAREAPAPEKPHHHHKAAKQGTDEDAGYSHRDSDSEYSDDTQEY